MSDASSGAMPLPAREYDDLVAAHLRTIPSARLWVGDGLAQANWDGLNETFGPLLAPHPDEAILAVYDDSAFGRGRAGFVLTDAALYVVRRSPLINTDAVARLADVRRMRVLMHTVALYVSADATLPALQQTAIALHIDEPDARAVVRAFLDAVVRRNRKVSDAEKRTARAQPVLEAIERLERAATMEQITPSQRRRLRALVARLDAAPGRGKAPRGSDRS